MPLSGGFSIFGCANSGSTKNDKAAYTKTKKDKICITAILGGMCGGEAGAREILTLYNQPTSYTQPYDYRLFVGSPNIES